MHIGRLNPTRMTVADAALRLRVTQDAISQRIRRETIAHEKDESGRVYVYLDATSTDHDGVHDANHDGVHDASVEELKTQNMFLGEQLEAEREANRENRRIIAGLVRRVPELEPASEPREASETASEDDSRGEEKSEEGLEGLLAAPGGKECLADS